MTDKITETLFLMADESYKAFHSRLMPTVDADTVIGVRVPQVRALAADLVRRGEAEHFLSSLPHKYYEENNLHAFILNGIKEYDKCIKELERFLPYVDNWATCDSIRPKCFTKNKERLLSHIKKWLLIGHTYTVRFAVEMLMVHFLDEDFKDEYLHLAASAENGEYYVDMMVAWYFATALSKQYERAVVFLLERRLSVWTHNKTIQKAIESYRIEGEIKENLKKLRRK